MIKVYEASEKLFNNNGLKIIKPLKAEISKIDNGDYYLDLEAPIEYSEWITKDNIIRCDTVWGEQSFRLGNPETSSRKIIVRAKHLYFDSTNYTISNVSIINKTALEALNLLLSSTDQVTPFTVYSSSDELKSIEIKNKSLEESIALLVELYNMHLERDNFNITLSKTIGADRGVNIEYAKNLTDFKCVENWDNVITKILPVVNNDIKLPEEYLLSDVQYSIPYTRIVSFSTTEGVDTENSSAVIDDLRTQAQKYLEENKYPKTNYTLSAHLDNVVDIGDTILVKHKKLNINVLTNVISVKYDCISQRFKQIEFGNFKNELKNLLKTVNNQIVEAKKDTNIKYSFLDSELQKAKDTINQFLFEGHRYETDNATYFLDTTDINTAKNVMMISLGGISFSQNGLNGTYTSAWTIDGKFNASFINTGVLSTILLKSTNYVPNVSGMLLSLINGSIDSKYFKVIDGKVYATDGEFTGKVTSSVGEIGGWQIEPNSLSSYNTLASLNLYNQANKAMQISYNGLHLFNHYSGNNEYLGGAVATYNPTSNTNGIVLTHATNSEYIAFGYAYGEQPTSGMAIARGMIYSHFGFAEGGTNYQAGFTFLEQVYCMSGIIDSSGYAYPTRAYVDLSFAPIDHTHRTSSILADDSTQGYIQFSGAQAAGYYWVDTNFQRKSSSDMRLKKNIKSLDDLPIELFMEIKAKQYEFKVDGYEKGIVFGVLAQEIESAFNKYGLNPFDYNLIELVDVRKETDEGFYIQDKVHRVNYNNFIAWEISVTQKQQKKINQLENDMTKIKAMLNI